MSGWVNKRGQVIGWVNGRERKMVIEWLGG